MLPMQEYLEIRQDNEAPNAWVRKHCRLNGVHLSYSSEQEMAAEVEIDVRECRLDFGHPKSPVFSLSFKDSRLRFKAPNNGSKLGWFNTMSFK